MQARSAATASRIRTLLGAPIQRNADVARLSARPIDDLEFYSVTLRLQILLPECKQFFWQPGKRILPAGLLLIDGAATIREKAIWKPADFNFGLTVVDRPAYDRGCPFQPLVIGYT